MRGDKQLGVPNVNVAFARKALRGRDPEFEMKRSEDGGIIQNDSGLTHQRPELRIKADNPRVEITLPEIRVAG